MSLRWVQNVSRAQTSGFKAPPSEIWAFSPGHSKWWSHTLSFPSTKQSWTIARSVSRHLLGGLGAAIRVCDVMWCAISDEVIRISNCYRTTGGKSSKSVEGQAVARPAVSLILSLVTPQHGSASLLHWNTNGRLPLFMFCNVNYKRPLVYVSRSVCNRSFCLKSIH